LIAVKGLTYLLSSPATEVSPNSAQIDPESTKVKIGNNGVYRGPVNFLFSPGTIAHPAFTSSGTNTAPATFTISPSKITKVKADGQIVLGEGDESPQVAVTGMMTSGSSTAPTTAMVSLKIQVAGQSVASGN
jgi:hypothetical protein